MIMFEALSQETRLRAYQLLVTAGPAGLAAGKLSEALNTPHNTMSFHLNHLSNAKLISSHKEGRSVIYTANFTMTHDLIEFLVKDCCRAEFATIRADEQAGGAVIELVRCCPPNKPQTTP